MADRRGGAGFEEAYEADCGGLAPQFVRAGHAARDDDGVVVASGHLVEGLADGKRLAGLQVVVDRAGRSGLRAD